MESSADGGGAREDPPAVQAPPVAVLGAGDAEHERDAVAGQERARRPHQHPLAAERDRDLEHGAGDAARRGSARSRGGSRTRSARAPAASRSRRRGAAGDRGASAAAPGTPCRGSARSACLRRRGGRAHRAAHATRAARSGHARQNSSNAAGSDGSASTSLDETVLEAEEQHLVEVEAPAASLAGGAVERRRALVAREHVDEPRGVRAAGLLRQAARGSGRSPRGRGRRPP